VWCVTVTLQDSAGCETTPLMEQLYFRFAASTNGDSREEKLRAFLCLTNLHATLETRFNQARHAAWRRASSK
jgi:hypothetical protein